MPDAPGSLVGHVAAAACLCFLFLVTPAAAQQPGPRPLEGPSGTLDFLSRYDFQLTATGLGSGDDPRFSWETHFGGAVDIIDYKYGRLGFVSDYEAILGKQDQPFDPNQAFYTLEASTSYWIDKTEVAAVFHHVSRHLGDRLKAYGIAWNVVQGRVLRRTTIANTDVSIRAGIGHTTAKADVDYTWALDGDLVLRRRLNDRTGLFAHGYAEWFGVDPLLRGRTSPERGGRIEGGVRIEGRAGAIEAFLGFEQRIDADPGQYLPGRWAIAGFRILNK